jgi:hypothetical protein
MDPLRFAAGTAKKIPAKITTLLLLDTLLSATGFLLCGYGLALHKWFSAVIWGIIGTLWLIAGGVNILRAVDPEPLEYERRY